MKVHETQIRVRYQETDNMGVVYYSNYFIWFEVARTEYLRSLGLSYKEMEKSGAFLMVAKAICEYKSPVRYDDLVSIKTWISAIKNSSLQFAHKLFVGSRLVAIGESVHVFTNNSGKPIRVPDCIKALHKDLDKTDNPTPG
jgi:acyl-CoA thioester hydrolase